MRNEKGREDEVGETGKDQIMQGFTDYDKEFECYFNCNEKPLEVAKEGVTKTALIQSRNFKKEVNFNGWT